MNRNVENGHRECACCHERFEGRQDVLEFLSTADFASWPQLVCRRCATIRERYYPNLGSTRAEQLRIWLALLRDQYGRSPSDDLAAQVDVIRFELSRREEAVRTWGASG